MLQGKKNIYLYQLLSIISDKFSYVFKMTFFLAYLSEVFLSGTLWNMERELGGNDEV